MTVVKTAFEEELEIFHTEEVIAQQCFFSYLSVRDMMIQDKEVLKTMNTASSFWAITHHSMLLSALIVLGRIFDNASKHNIDTLMAAVSKDLSVFSKAALAARRVADGSMTKAGADAYVKDRHTLTANDVKLLRKQIKHWRSVYESRYREVRHHFAHKKWSNFDDLNKLLKKTTINETKSLFAFLSALYLALSELFLNGRKPSLETREFALPPAPAAKREKLPGEIVYLQGHAVLKSMRG
jgi:hypothetical protein